ncbi:hypothetical protein WN48_02259 [Eufriesea mexicana]|uniref:Uncharacterized protein n=1 Tax=Eufriesea mexicana TaxID=516756 RepID=A0A310SQP2_9HYME|nr:hypothetical protein WN48_02259 [Eufriesea mexicana]
MFILTFLSTVLILSRGNARRTVDGFNMDSSNWDPFLFISKDLNESPNYDITCWVRQLHLQQCAFVEIGEGFCALFVELRSIPSESKVLDSSGVGEFFLGICPCLTLHTWDLCSLELTRQRKADCTFNEATPYSNTSARVHRRLCDITSLAESTSSCNCSISIAGFPTCFLNPLPESLCSPRGICGIAQCTATTIKGIHTPQCASNCHHRQPVMLFCLSSAKKLDLQLQYQRKLIPYGHDGLLQNATALVRKSSHRLYRTRIILVSQRSFREVPSNSLTMTKGVNFSSCPDSFSKCYCEVNMVDGIMRAARFTEPCISTEGCISSNVRTFTFEGELDPGNNIDFDEAYENDDRERHVVSPGISASSKTQPPASCECRPGGGIGHRGSAKGRRSPRKHTRETRSDYAAIAFEGKQEVDEPERKGPMEIRSATEECEDDSTEPLRYYDYENEDFVAGRVRGQSMRVGEETRKERSQFGEAVNDCRSPNTAGHVSVSTGWR